MKQSLRHLIQVSQYHQKPNFAEIGPFLDLLAPEASSEEWSVKGFFSYLKERHQQLSRLSGDSAQEVAVNRLLAENAAELSALSEDAITSFDQYRDFERTCTDALARASAVYQGFGIDHDLSIHFVSDFPPPYDGRAYQAMNFDQADSTNFGMDPGIYFLSAALRPLYSGYVALHESVHSVLGDGHPEEMVSPLEEGLCEIIGSVYISASIFGDLLTENLFIYNRLMPRKQIVWDTYLSNTRLAAAVFFAAGWEGVFELVKRGRPAIKDAERALFVGGELDLKLSSASNQRQPLQSILQRLTLVFDDVYVCSPLAYYVGKLAHAGASLREISTEARLPVEDVRAGLNELEENYNLVTVRPDGSVVVFSESGRSISIPTRLRYSFGDI